MIEVRAAIEADARWIRDIFVASYGNDYVYPDFYDLSALRRMILSDQELNLVAVDSEAGRPVATASVILEVGAFTDLVGEFGRLVVHPDWRNRGIGSRLVDERVRRVEDRLHVGLMEARVFHPFTQRLARRHGFEPVGLLPLKLRFGARRESVCVSVRYFGNALDLRRNHPRITPEAYALTCGALKRIGLRGHPLVDEESRPYPVGDYRVEEMSASGYADLLRIERGRLKRREIFGPLRLHYGLFRLQASDSCYLLAKRGGQVIGGVGYLADGHEGSARVFELITVEDEAIPFLLRHLLARLGDMPGMDYVEIDVSAYAPRMQRTLLDLGFSPAAYMPALAFHEVERLDVMRMVKLFIPLEEEAEFVSPTKEVAELVMASFRQTEVEPRVTEALDRIELFEGLDEPDVLEIAALFHVEEHPAGTEIFKAGDPSEEMWVILSGRVRIEVSEARRVGWVGAGECLGETALLTRTPHSADAVAETRIQVATVEAAALEALVRRRPSTGVVIYRNLASGLGSKLRRTGRGGQG